MAMTKKLPRLYRDLKDTEAVDRTAMSKGGHNPLFAMGQAYQTGVETSIRWSRGGKKKGDLCLAATDQLHFTRDRCAAA
jgi:hypothetical protein